MRRHCRNLVSTIDEILRNRRGMRISSIHRNQRSGIGINQNNESESESMNQSERACVARLNVRGKILDDRRRLRMRISLPRFVLAREITDHW
jgi:hypothetical protein